MSVSVASTPAGVADPRTARHALRRKLWAATSLPRVAKCGRVQSEAVDDGYGQVQLQRRYTVDQTTGEKTNGSTSLVGLQTCGSVHACPVCAAAKREKYARDIDRAAARHLAAGGGIEFLTLTIRHAAWTDETGRRNFHRLSELWEALQGAWNRTNVGRDSELCRELYGIQGAVRVVDVTWSPANGWHPHVHALVFTDAPLTEDERHRWLFGKAEYEQGEDGRWRKVAPEGLWPRWRGGVAKSYDGEGDVRPELPYGLKCDPVRSHAEIARYLVNVEGVKWSPGRELARIDTKTSKTRTGFQPFGLLEASVDQALELDQRLLYAAAWREWEQASHGRKAVTFSPGLLERCFDLPAVPDETRDPDDDPAETLWTFSTADRGAAVWYSGELLAAGERDQAPLVVSRLVLTAHGIDPPDPEGCIRCAVHRGLCDDHYGVVWMARQTEREAVSQTASPPPAC